MNEREAIEKLIQLQKIKIEEVGKCGYTIAIDTILKQLQAYKDKEDKALKYMKDNSSNGNVDVSGVGCDTTDDFDIQELSQILNEGSEIDE